MSLDDAKWKRSFAILKWRFGKQYNQSFLKRRLEAVISIGHKRFLSTSLRMDLKLLPSELIRRAFKLLNQEAKTFNDNRLVTFMEYVRRQWIDSKMFPPETWCQFMKGTRTNNDLESWHHRINKRAMNPNVNFYFLVQVLFNEAQLVEINLRILSVQESRKGYVEKQKLLFEVWNAFIEGNISAGTMHGRCSRLVGCPSNL